LSNGEKSKDNNGDGNMSDSSSDSDEEHGSSKEDCIRQFKVVIVMFLLDSRDSERAFGLHVFFSATSYCTPCITLFFLFPE
jgi:hypothetical protein